MSAPELPDIFGNYVLGEFVEVVSPAAISWLPQTPGWPVVGCVLLLLIGRYACRRLMHWYSNRYRREACRRLHQIAAAPDGTALTPQLNQLLKITAIAGFSREQVARLSGQAWIEFLNGSCPTPPFEQELGQWLAAGPYRGDNPRAPQGEQLIIACERWIREHEAPAGV